MDAAHAANVNSVGDEPQIEPPKQGGQVSLRRQVGSSTKLSQAEADRRSAMSTANRSLRSSPGPSATVATSSSGTSQFLKSSSMRAAYTSELAPAFRGLNGRSEA